MFNISQFNRLKDARLASDSGIYVEDTAYSRTMIFHLPHGGETHLARTEVTVSRLPQESKATASLWTGEWTDLVHLAPVGLGDGEDWWFNAPGYMRARQPKAEAFTAELAVSLIERLRDTMARSTTV